MWTDTVLGVQLCLLTFKFRYVTQRFYWRYCEISNAWNDWEGLRDGAVDCVKSLGFFIDFILPATLGPWVDSACDTNELLTYLLHGAESFLRN